MRLLNRSAVYQIHGFIVLAIRRETELRITFVRHIDEVDAAKLS